MERSGREVEIKLSFDSAEAARRRLAEVGARSTGERLFEDNLVFDREVDPLEPAGKLLRLRRSGPTALLTFKSPVEGEHRHKVREEHESSVADAEAVERLLVGLGFRAVYRYQKYRTGYAWEGLHVCLDETPIGCFVELEGDPAAIDRAAAALGFPPDRWVLETYRDLHERAASARGEEPGDLVFARGAAEGRP